MPKVSYYNNVYQNLDFCSKNHILFHYLLYFFNSLDRSSPVSIDRALKIENNNLRKNSSIHASWIDQRA